MLNVYCLRSDQQAYSPTHLRVLDLLARTILLPLIIAKRRTDTYTLAQSSFSDPCIHQPPVELQLELHLGISIMHSTHKVHATWCRPG